MKQWKNLHSSFLHQFGEDNVLPSLIETSFHRNTVEQNSFDIQQRDIQVRKLNDLPRETTFTPLQLNNSFRESSSTPSEQCTVVSKSQPSMKQSNNDVVSAGQSSTTQEILNTCALQEPVQYTLPGSEVPGTDRLEILAQRLSDEIFELLLQSFGMCDNLLIKMMQPASLQSNVQK